MVDVVVRSEGDVLGGVNASLLQEAEQTDAEANALEQGVRQLRSNAAALRSAAGKVRDVAGFAPVAPAGGLPGPLAQAALG